MSVKFPEGFICHNYYLIKRKGIKKEYILQCKECGKQHTLLGGTILGNSNLSLPQILTALYLFFTRNRELSAPYLANNINVSVKITRRYLRKFRILIAEKTTRRTWNHYSMWRTSLRLLASVEKYQKRSSRY